MDLDEIRYKYRNIRTATKGEESEQTAYTLLCGKDERCRYAQDFLGFSWKELANCASLLSNHRWEDRALRKVVGGYTQKKTTLRVCINTYGYAPEQDCTTFISVPTAVNDGKVLHLAIVSTDAQTPQPGSRAPYS